jgi:hypothetical protein
MTPLLAAGLPLEPPMPDPAAPEPPEKAAPLLVETSAPELFEPPAEAPEESVEDDDPAEGALPHATAPAATAHERTIARAPS